VYQVGLDGAAATEEFLEKVPGNYEIAVKEGTKPQVALVYRQMGEDNARSLATSFYDIEKGVWSKEITLTEEEGYIRSFKPVFTKDGKLSAAYTKSKIITEVINGEERPKTSDKVDLYAMAYTPHSDLAVDEEFGLQFSPENPLPATTAKVAVVIQNEGDYAETAKLYLYDGNPAAGGIKIGEVITKEPIPARSSAQVEVSWVVKSEERDKYNIYAVVDPEDNVWETDESNNTISHEIITADIAVTDLIWENLAKDDYLVTAKIRNTGSRSLQGTEVQLVNDQNAEPAASRTFEDLRPGQEAGVNFVISSAGLAADTDAKISMALTAALPDGVEEFATDNNVYEFALKPAQVVVNRIKPGPGEAQVGIQQPLTINFNMNVEQGTDFAQIILEDDNLNTIDVAKTLEGRTLTVIPQSPLDYNTRYTLTIPREAVGDSYGHKMGDAYELSFATTSSSPEIVFAYPGDGLKDIPLNTDIKIQFNRDVFAGASFGGIKLHGPGSEEIPASVSIRGEWLYVNPEGNLDLNSAYSLLIPAAAVKNEKGEILQEEYAVAFETGETIAEEEENNNDNDSGDDDPPFGFKVTRQTAVDGSTMAMVAIDRITLLDMGEGDEETVIINLTDEVKGDETINVNLTESAAKQLAANQSSLKIVTGKGDLLLPIGMLAPLVGDGEDSIGIAIARNNEQETGSGRVSDGVFDFSVSRGKEPVTVFSEAVIVTIPLDMSRVGKAKRVIVSVYDEVMNSWQPVGGTADAADGSITFKTKHFSTYAAFETVKHFDDVTSDWAKEEVEILASRGLISGKTAKTFAPEDNITRAEFTTLIIRALYRELIDRKGTFIDVPKNAWFRAPVETAYVKGLISGLGEGRFEPNAPISREQLAAIAYKFYQYKTGKTAVDSGDNTFMDRQDISSWAGEAVDFVANAEIMIGSSGRFYPKRSTTRQEAAVVLYKLLEYMGEL